MRTALKCARKVKCVKAFTRNKFLNRLIFSLTLIKFFLYATALEVASLFFDEFRNLSCIHTIEFISNFQETYFLIVDTRNAL